MHLQLRACTVLVDLGSDVVDAGRVASSVGGSDRLVSVVDDANGSVKRHLDGNVMPHE